MWNPHLTVEKYTNAEALQESVGRRTSTGLFPVSSAWGEWSLKKPEGKLALEYLNWFFSPLFTPPPPTSVVEFA